MMFVPVKYSRDIQELVEMEDLNKIYTKMPFIALLLKVDFKEIMKLLTIWQNK